MSADTDPTRPAAADAAAAPLDLLVTDAATGMLRRVTSAGRPDESFVFLPEELSR